MRALLRIAVGATALLAGVVGAEACTEPSFMVFFDSGSTALSEPGRRTLTHVSHAVGAQHAVPAQCANVTIVAHIDGAEAVQFGESFGLDRGYSVQRQLVELGAHASSIKVVNLADSRPLVRQKVGASELQNRFVEVTKQLGGGRWRCDQTRFVPGPYTTCGPPVNYCYLELSDGTICNIHGVPDPEPARYSINPFGDRIK